jgi:Glycosyl transferase family 2
VAASASPRISVVIATYNYSSVLYYSVASVLAQTVQDFELIVVGDGCTDDSAEVIAAFNDPRIRWHNLPENTGYQAVPDNTGWSMARGEFIAYLGHDDLWMPNHLSSLLPALEGGADLAYSMGVMVAPPGNATRVLTGASASGAYEPGLLVPPSTFAHRASMENSLRWKDFRELHTPGDIAFTTAFWAAKKKIVAIPEVTVFKFPGPWRKDVYKLRPSHEQREYSRRMQEEPDFLAREMTAVALCYATGGPRSPVVLEPPAAGAPAGYIVDQFREAKGLPRLPGTRRYTPLGEEPDALRSLNSREDIVPRCGLDALYEGNDLPANSLYLGRGWHLRELDENGPFRWLDTDGEVVVANPNGKPGWLVLDVESGPGQRSQPFELSLLDDSGAKLGSATVSFRHEVSFDVPAGSSFRLVPASPGIRVPPDNRILNVRVFGIRWG